MHTHALTVPASSKGPEYKTARSGHCRKNPSGKEIYTAGEVQEIADLYFKDLANVPHVVPIPHALDFPNGNKYDLLIAGWTKFWNEILKPDDPLTPDFVKALIATESSFEVQSEKKSKEGVARGLIQITERTRHILRNDPNRELRNHLIDMSAEEAQASEVNIAAGIHWLHHKRILLKKRLKREVRSGSILVMNLLIRKFQAKNACPDGSLPPQRPSPKSSSACRPVAAAKLTFPITANFPRTTGEALFRKVRSYQNERMINEHGRKRE